MITYHATLNGRVALAIALTCSVSSVMGAQNALPLIDSVTIDFASRYDWRGYDRGRGATLKTAVSLGLAGYSKSQDTGPRGRNNLSLDVVDWLPLANRHDRRREDQAELSLRYGRCLFACESLEWADRGSFAIAYSQYYFPSVTGSQFSEELYADYRQLISIEDINGRQLGLKVYPFVEAMHDFKRFSGTLTRAGVGGEIGPKWNKLYLEAQLSASASNYRARDGGTRSFGFHDAEFQPSIRIDFGTSPIPTLARVYWQLILPASRVGSKVGVVGIDLRVLVGRL
jgi:hypothetical protein